MAPLSAVVLALAALRVRGLEALSALELALR